MEDICLKRLNLLFVLIVVQLILMLEETMIVWLAFVVNVVERLVQIFGVSKNYTVFSGTSDNGLIINMLMEEELTKGFSYKRMAFYDFMEGKL